MSATKIYTIGHTNHSIDEFTARLGQHGIEALVDIRRFPASSRLPHFNKPDLAKALAKHDIEYVWLESLGGHRQEALPDSPNFGLKEESFRNYADHMLTESFRAGADQLLEMAKNKTTAIMCAEKSFQDCHRQLTSDFLVANGGIVQHILADGTLEPHKLHELAKLEENKVTYPERHPLFD